MTIHVYQSPIPSSASQHLIHLLLYSCSTQAVLPSLVSAYERSYWRDLVFRPSYPESGSIQLEAANVSYQYHQGQVCSDSSSSFSNISETCTLAFLVCLIFVDARESRSQNHTYLENLCLNAEYRNRPDSAVRSLRTFKSVKKGHAFSVYGSDRLYQYFWRTSFHWKKRLKVRDELNLSDGSCWEIIIIKQIHTFTSNTFFWATTFRWTQSIDRETSGQMWGWEKEWGLCALRHGIVT